MACADIVPFLVIGVVVEIMPSSTMAYWTDRPPTKRWFPLAVYAVCLEHAVFNGVYATV